MKSLTDLANAHEVYEAVRALLPGLPGHVITLDLHIAANEVPTVTITYHPTIPPPRGEDLQTERKTFAIVDQATHGKEPV